MLRPNRYKRDDKNRLPQFRLPGVRRFQNQLLRAAHHPVIPTKVAWRPTRSEFRTPVESSESRSERGMGLQKPENLLWPVRHGRSRFFSCPRRAPGMTWRGMARNEPYLRSRFHLWNITPTKISILPFRLRLKLRFNRCKRLKARVLAILNGNASIGYGIARLVGCSGTCNTLSIGDGLGNGDTNPFQFKPCARRIHKIFLLTGLAMIEKDSGP